MQSVHFKWVFVGIECFRYFYFPDRVHQLFVIVMLKAKSSVHILRNSVFSSIIDWRRKMSSVAF